MHVRRLNMLHVAPWLAVACVVIGSASCSDDVEAKSAAEDVEGVDLDLPEEWRVVDGSASRLESEAELEQQRDGRVTLWRENGAKSAEGEIAGGKKQGAWSFWREDGSLRWEGAFVDDVAHGVERGWHANGQLWFEGERVQGKRQGTYRYWYENGALELEAEFRDDVRDGPCKKFTLDGAVDPAQTGRYEQGRKVKPN